MKSTFLLLLIAFTFSISLRAQEDSMLDLLPEDEPEVEYVTAGFKTTRIINGHSFELNSHGVLDFKISHRFGTINSGAINAFGLDNALMRIGLDYGVLPWLNVGIGRSGGAVKYYDGFVKAKVIRQQRGKKEVPLSVLWVSDMAVDGNPVTNSELDPYLFTNRLEYTHQVIIGRKFSEGLSLQLMPTLVHRNFVMNKQAKNDVFALGAGGRVKLTKRIALNLEYYYVLPDQLDPTQNYTNSISVGFDIETGGHVFQLHFTNSTAMVENAFITKTTGDWTKGDIRFGFNVSRVFTVYRPKK